MWQINSIWENGKDELPKSRKVPYTTRLSLPWVEKVEEKEEDFEKQEREEKEYRENDPIRKFQFDLKFIFPYNFIGTY